MTFGEFDNKSTNKIAVLPVSKLDTGLFLRFVETCGMLCLARRAGPAPKGGTPMGITETIALLMLVIAAVSLGLQIKK